MPLFMRAAVRRPLMRVWTITALNPGLWSVRLQMVWTGLEGWRLCSPHPIWERWIWMWLSGIIKCILFCRRRIMMSGIHCSQIWRRLKIALRSQGLIADNIIVIIQEKSDSTDYSGFGRNETLFKEDNNQKEEQRRSEGENGFSGSCSFVVWWRKSTRPDWWAYQFICVSIIPAWSDEEV